MTETFPVAVNISGAKQYSIPGVPELSAEVILNFSEKTGLEYVHLNDREDNLCYARFPELREEFRQNFTLNDLRNYIHAVLHSEDYLPDGTSKHGLLQIPYPADADFFWKMAAAGAKF